MSSFSITKESVKASNFDIFKSMLRESFEKVLSELPRPTEDDYVDYWPVAEDDVEKDL